MTGLPNYNYPKFFSVAKTLEDKGFKVINPANIGVQEGWDWDDYMNKALIDLLTNGVNTIMTLDGWENSKGARLEVHVGIELGMRIVEFEDFIKSD